MIFLLKFRSNSLKANFSRSTFAALLLIFTVYSLALITFAFMMSAVFLKTNKATAFTAILWILNFIPYLQMVVPAEYRSASRFRKKGLCLLHNAAMALSIQKILRYEASFDELNLTSLNDVHVDNISMMDILQMLAIDIFVYILTTVVILSFQRIQNSKKSFDELEMQSKRSRKSIEIRNLFKTYKGGKTALKDLTVDFYEDQITVILGENGAGKTTLMSMICGLLRPSSGSIKFKGKSPIGICFQQNVLFDNLTVREHIKFFSILKGLNQDAANQEADKLIKSLSFQAKSDSYSSKISGGMQRKLSMAIALCGNSKVVLIDEVSSGVDPTTQRDLWNLLQEEKKGRTILLTTHSMMEAEVLADEVAVFREGSLKGYGTVSELKEKFCNSFKLTCRTEKSSNQSEIVNVIKSFDKNAKIQSQNESKIIVKIENSPVIAEIVEYLERKKFELNIEGLGIASSTVEDLFDDISSEHTERNIGPKSCK